MQRPASEWDEEYVLSLPREDDSLERKGIRLLDLTVPDVDEDEVRDQLAKQLSAFANTGGGRVIYGLTNNGEVDEGGVSRIVKGRRTTKEWLEDLIPGLTDYEIVGVNVYEITGEKSDSAIQPDKALYVIDVPDSERAPHQSKRDLKYYVRLGASSQPASHRLIEDIRNGARHPNVLITSAEIQIGEAIRESTANTIYKVSLPTVLVIANRGRVKATNTCILMEYESNLCSLGRFAPSVARRRAGTRASTILLELQHPVYPEMETALHFVWELRPELTVGAGSTLTWLLQGANQSPDDLMISYRIFADSAPPNSGHIRLGDLGFSAKVREILTKGK